MANDFKFGNKAIQDLYFGDTPVVAVYFGDKLIWQRQSDVPYDNTCTIIITGDDTTQKFTVQVMKNGEDVTSSLDHFNCWAYLVNDVLPSYRLFVHNVPYSDIITDATEISITELINACKASESITDSRYDNTKGEYSIDASEITSKAGGSFPSTGAISCQNHITIPYTLTQDYSNHDVWMVVKHNTSSTPLEIKTIKVATSYTGDGTTYINVFHESGILVYSYTSNWNIPSVTTKVIDGTTYNYVVVDLTALSTGTFRLKRNEKYYIRIRHDNNNQNNYYYRNGGILGIVGYATGTINIPNDTYDLNSLTYDGIKTAETDMLYVNTVNHYARYNGSSNIFSANTIYKCKKSFVFRGVLSDSDIFILAANDGEVGYYSGPASELGVTGAFVKSGAAIWVTATDTPSTIYTENDSTKIFKFTGNTTADIFYKNKFYSCKKPLISSNDFKGEITSAPSYTDVSVGDIYLVLNSINYGHYSSHYAAPGIWKVTSVDLAGEDYIMTKENTTDYIIDETNNMKAKLSSFSRTDYYDVMYGTDLSSLTINTDHKYEILMES